MVTYIPGTRIPISGRNNIPGTRLPGTGSGGQSTAGSFGATVSGPSIASGGTTPTTTRRGGSSGGSSRRGGSSRTPTTPTQPQSTIEDFKPQSTPETFLEQQQKLRDSLTNRETLKSDLTPEQIRNLPVGTITTKEGIIRLPQGYKFEKTTINRNIGGYYVDPYGRIISSGLNEQQINQGLTANQKKEYFKPITTGLEPAITSGRRYVGSYVKVGQTSDTIKRVERQADIVKKEAQRKYTQSYLEAASKQQKENAFRKAILENKQDIFKKEVIDAKIPYTNTNKVKSGIEPIAEAIYNIPSGFFEELKNVPSYEIPEPIRGAKTRFGYIPEGIYRGAYKFREGVLSVFEEGRQITKSINPSYLGLPQRIEQGKVLEVGTLRDFGSAVAGAGILAVTGTVGFASGLIFNPLGTIQEIGKKPISSLGQFAVFSAAGGFAPKLSNLSKNIVFGQPLKSIKFRITEPGRGTTEAYLIQDVPKSGKFKSGADIAIDKQISALKATKTERFVNPKIKTESGLPRSIYVERTSSGKFKKFYYEVKEPLIVKSTPSQAAGPEIISVGGKFQELSQVSGGKIPRTKGIIGKSGFEVIKQTSGANIGRKFASGLETAYFQGLADKYLGYPQAYGYYAGIAEAKYYSGYKFGLENKPSINLSKEFVEAVPKELLKKPSKAELAETQRVLDALTPGSKEALLKRYNLEQLTLYKRLATVRDIPGTTQVGSAPLTGIRGEFEVTTASGTIFKRTNIATKKALRNLFNVGDVRAKIAGKTFDLFFDKKINAPIPNLKVGEKTDLVKGKDFNPKLFENLGKSSKVYKTIEISKGSIIGGLSSIKPLNSIISSRISSGSPKVSNVSLTSSSPSVNISSVSVSKINPSISSSSPSISSTSISKTSISSTSISSGSPSISSTSISSGISSIKPSVSSISISSKSPSISSKNISSISSSVSSSISSKISSISKTSSISKPSISITSKSPRISNISKNYKKVDSKVRSLSSGVKRNLVSSRVSSVRTGFVYPKQRTSLGSNRINLLPKQPKYSARDVSSRRLDRANYLDKLVFNDSKFLNNRVNAFGVRSSNIFGVSNRFSKKTKLSIEDQIKGMKRETNKYNYSNKYSIGLKGYKYKTQYKDADLFDVKRVL